jgi:hypothetical protein
MSRKNTTYGAFFSKGGKKDKRATSNGKITDDLFRRIS